MFWKYITFSMKQVFRNGWTSLLNIAGLSIGMAALLYAVMLHYYEHHYDTFHKDAERMYRVTSEARIQDRTIRQGYCLGGVGTDMPKDIIGVEESCHVSYLYNPFTLKIDGTYENAALRWADTSFFSFTGWPLITGDPHKVLDAPHKLVITQSAAQRLFGDKDPVGERMVHAEGGSELVISGVMADPPKNTHLQMDVLNSSSMWREALTSWDAGMNWLTYIKLTPGYPPDRVREQLPGWLEEKFNAQSRDKGYSYSLDIQPINEVHLTSGMDYDERTNRSRSSVYLILLISFLIIVLAVINYTNLSLAVQETRLQTTAIQKVIGASGRHLKTIYVVEAFVSALVAGLLGLCLLSLGIEFINRLTGSVMSLGDYPWLAAAAFGGIVLLTTFLAGWVPAWITAGRTITANLKNSLNLKKNKAQPLRQYLVGFQFFVTIVLLILLGGIYQQSDYLLHKDLGYNKEEIIHLRFPDGIASDTKMTFREELLKISGIRQVSLSREPVGAGNFKSGYATLDEKDRVSLYNSYYTDNWFVDCYGLTLAAGRGFHKDVPEEKHSILVNKELVQRLGWEDPLGKQLFRDGKTYKVVGVLEDFHFTSLYQNISPLVVHCGEVDNNFYSYTNIRYHAGDREALVQSIEEKFNELFPHYNMNYQYHDTYLAYRYSSLKKDRRAVSLFSVLALMIALMGVTGITLFANVRKAKEIGIRKVNGARSMNILQLLLSGVFLRLLTAFLVAVPLAYWLLQRWLEEFAYKTTIGGSVYLFSGGFILLFTLLTSGLLSWRTANMNPVRVLRDE